MMPRIKTFAAALVIAAFSMTIAWSQPRRGLVLYAALGYGPAVAAAFTKETGIPVHVVSLRTRDLLDRIAAEGHHPRWSLGWFDDAPAAIVLDRHGLLAHGLPAPVSLNRWGAGMTSPDGAYVPTGFSLAGVFVTAADPYLTPPADWSALTGAPYRGVIGMSDPALAQTAYPALASMLENGGKPFIRTLKMNGLHIYARNAEILAALRSGSIALGILPAGIALDAASRDKSLYVTVPHPAYAAPSVIVMAKGLAAKQRREGEQFIAFVNRPSVQGLRMRAGGSDGLYWPVITDPRPPANLPSLSPRDAVTLNAEKWGAREQNVLAWFDRRIVGTGT
jgi:iron(III) transport system substrate-binding protein